jgi:hypothetical protein
VAHKCATIHCTVDNCKYWTEHNMCSADSILITAPASPLPRTDPHGTKAETLHHTPVQQVVDTLCYTFEQK